MLTAAGFQVVSQYTASALPKDQVISMSPTNYGQQMQKGSVLDAGRLGQFADGRA